MKLNRKGYLTVEIILASVVAFAIAFFLMELTVKLVSKSDDTFHNVVVSTDNALIIENLKEKIEDDIITQEGLYSINCINNEEKNECKIIFNKTNSQADERYLYYDKVNKEIKYAIDEVQRIVSYSKKVDNSISEVTITANFSENNKIALFNIKEKDIFTGTEYNITIPINTVPVTTTATIYLNINGRYNNNYNDSITFVKGNGYEIDLYSKYDQIFGSENNSTLLVCYTDENKTINYDFEELDTIRYQHYRLQISDDIPDKLYCNFSENY